MHFTVPYLHQKIKIPSVHWWCEELNPSVIYFGYFVHKKNKNMEFSTGGGGGVPPIRQNNEFFEEKMRPLLKLCNRFVCFFRWSEEGAWMRGMHSYSSLPRSRYSSVARREIDLGPLHRVWYKK